MGPQIYLGPIKIWLLHIQTRFNLLRPGEASNYDDDDNNSNDDDIDSDDNGEDVQSPNFVTVCASSLLDDIFCYALFFKYTGAVLVADFDLATEVKGDKGEVEHC